MSVLIYMYIFFLRIYRRMGLQKTAAKCQLGLSIKYGICYSTAECQFSKVCVIVFTEL